MTTSTAPSPYKSHRFPLEIVCPHMTKTHILTRRSCGNHVPDLYVVVRHNHAVHEAFNELTLLLERRVLQPCPDARTKGLNRGDQRPHCYLAIDAKCQLPFLLKEALPLLLQVFWSTPVFLEREHSTQICIREPFQLLLQTGRRFL